MNQIKKPNILFIMTDQQRFDALSTVNPAVKTPYLDQLITESVFFKRAYCSNPSCVPSRAAIMTGKFPSECQVPTYITSLPKDEVTFMTRLQEAGYYTAVIGKQHFAGSPIAKGYNYEHIIDCHSAFGDAPGSDDYRAFLRQHDVEPDQIMTRGLISGGTWNVDENLHLDAYVGNLGKQWLSEKVTESKTEMTKPWFFTLSFPGPHHPYDGEGTSFADLYPLAEITHSETTYDDLAQKPPHFRKMGNYSRIYLKDFSEETFLRTKRAYLANVSLIDQKIGEVIQVLKDNNVYDDTLIIFTSDHGDFMGDFGMVEKLQCLTDSLMRVPLFVKPPIKGFVGIEIDDPVLNIDIAATCLQAAGVTVDESVSNYLYTCYWDETVEMKVRDALYMEAGDIKGVLKNGIKTIYYLNRDYGELYDLNQDPLEKVNHWDNPAYALQKLEAYRILVDNMYRAIPKNRIKWNIGTPEI